jgi:hypothetical protein
MAYLGNAPARSFISFERQVFTIVNSQTAYTLDHSVNNENDIRLVINNIVQEPGSGKAYTASGTTLTLSAALVNGTDEMYCVFLGRATATNAPGAASVGTSQLASDAVTAAKLNDDIISGQTALGATPADTDEFLISDAGVLKRMDYSYIKASSDFVKLATSTTTASTSTIEFTGLDTSVYRGYMVAIQNLVFASSQNLNMQVGTSSGYLTDSDYNSTVVEDNSRTDYSAANSSRGPNSMSNAFSATMWIWPAPNTDIEAAQRALFFFYQGFQRSGGDRLGFTAVEDTSLAGTVFSKFKMFGNSGGNFEAGGTVTVYGVKY